MSFPPYPFNSTKRKKPFTLPLPWRPVIRIALWLIPIASTALSLVTLPVVYAFVIGITSTVIPILLAKILFSFRSIHVMPAFPDMCNEKQLGTFLFSDKFQGKPILGIGTVYETEDAAKMAFQVVRSWNYGYYVDKDQNVIVSIVRRSNGRYSVFIRPGWRKEATEVVKEFSRANMGPNAEPQMMILQNFIFNHLDYSAAPEKAKFMESFKGQSSVQINCGFLVEGELRVVSKRPIRTTAVFITDEADLAADTIESRFEWFDVRQRLSKGHVGKVDAMDQELQRRNAAASSESASQP